MGDLDVRGFKIAVNDAFFVGRLHPAAHMDAALLYVFGAGGGLGGPAGGVY